MAKRKKSNALNIFLIILLVIIILICKIIDDKNNKSYNTVNKSVNDNVDKKDEVDKKTTDKSVDKDNTKSTSNTENDNYEPVKDEEKETKNEIERKSNKGVKLELIGESKVTVKTDTKYVDAGVKAFYEDGTDASDIVEVDGEVDTSKPGTYTISYYVGNSVVIRRIIVEE